MVVLIMLWRVYHLEIIWENLQHIEFSGQVALSSHILWRWSFSHFIRNLINLKMQFPKGDCLRQV